MKNASMGQLGEIVARLVDGRIGNDRAHAIIEGRVELPSTGSVRERQARRVFDKFGSALGIGDFDSYLEGTDAVEAVPQIPQFPATHVRLFGRDSVCLVDRRVVKQIGLKEYCRLAGLVYTGEDNTFEAFDTKRAKDADIYWMLYQDGYRNRNRKPSDCRKTFAPFEVGMSEVEGVSVYLQNPEVIVDHYLDLPGSVRRGDRGGYACLGVVGGRPELRWGWVDDADPKCGSASRGE